LRHPDHLTLAEIIDAEREEARRTGDARMNRQACDGSEFVHGRKYLAALVPA
jgi:hypothetical protein